MKVLEIENSTEVAVVMEKHELVSLLRRIKVMSPERFMHFGAVQEHAIKSSNFFSSLDSATIEVFSWRSYENN